MTAFTPATVAATGTCAGRAQNAVVRDIAPAAATGVTFGFMFAKTYSRSTVMSRTRPPAKSDEGVVAATNNRNPHAGYERQPA